MKKARSSTQKLSTPSSIQHPPAAVSTDFDTPYLMGAALIGVGLLLFGILLRTTPASPSSVETPRDPLAATTLLEGDLGTGSAANPDANSTPSGGGQAVAAAPVTGAPANGAGAAQPAPAAQAAATGGGGATGAPAAPAQPNNPQKVLRPILTPILTPVYGALGQVLSNSGKSNIQARGKANGKKK